MDHGYKTFREKFETAYTDNLSGSPRKKAEQKSDRPQQTQKTKPGETEPMEPQPEDKVGNAKH